MYRSILHPFILKVCYLKGVNGRKDLRNLSAASRGESAPVPVPFERIFESLPHLALILSPELMIRGVSDAYLEATLSEREKIVSRYVFDVFPDNLYTPQASSVNNLKASLEQVIRTKKAHQMPIQHYDVPDPKAPGQFAERYWSPFAYPENTFGREII